jgi:hypothetical protein
MPFRTHKEYKRETTAYMPLMSHHQAQKLTRCYWPSWNVFCTWHDVDGLATISVNKLSWLTGTYPQ